MAVAMPRAASAISIRGSRAAERGRGHGANRSLRRNRLVRLGAELAQRLAEQRTLGRAQLRIAVDERFGAGAGALEQRRVLRQLGDRELPDARLTRADELALAAQLEIDLSEAEAV